jgi:hypothetical protein
VDLNFIRGQFTEAELESAIISLFEMQDYEHKINFRMRTYLARFLKMEIVIYE